MVHVPAMAIAAPLLALSVYRRVRRNISRQKFSPWRLWLRSGFLTIAFFALLRWPAFNAEIAMAMIAGAAAGSLLALQLGIRHTRFEQQPDGLYYTPNVILGTAISLIFIARMIYRLIVIYPLMQAAEVQGPAFSSQMFAGSRTALTMGLLGLVIGYFVAYCVGLLQRGKAQAASTVAATPA